MKLDTFLQIKYAYAYGSNKWRDASLKDLDKSQKYNLPINATAGTATALIGGTAAHVLGKRMPLPITLALATAGGLGSYALSDYLLKAKDSSARAKIYEINKQYNDKHKIKSFFGR